MQRLGFSEAKRRVIAALDGGQYQNAARNEIETKNQLQTGQISAQALSAVLLRSKGQHHSSSPHHQVADIEVHVIKIDGWYIKFFFLNDPETVFISVHR
ncbi:MAG: hypothetical protein HLUCCO17_13005 [Saliniramus fredricksonii]|uniref:Uncharacterized protein n=1 Tax=Saliniramus fredricksonii TaxID=1653334 RepID=A0A0N8KDY2_9HYPH|nr:hypothetical protein [Saliniramus fredricksonii]KPQ09810.1 MAG: hypothetical protein HLUCCO17_13005 [Saliniramus fredricksonii]